MDLKPTRITEESIRGYGKPLHTSSQGPASEGEAFRFIADVYRYDFSGKITVGILTGKKREIRLTRLERHVKTVELLIQLEGDAVIYLAKASAGIPAPEEVQAFMFNQGEAIALDEGVWHWIPFPLKKDCTTLVIYKDGTGSQDYEAKDLY
jgi:ureidoglycolate hydrolase